MAYAKQTWVDNETPVDAEHLNHIEEGVAAISEEMAAFAEVPQTQTGKIVRVETNEGVPISVESVGNVVQSGRNLFEVGSGETDYPKKAYNISLMTDQENQVFSMLMNGGSSAWAYRGLKIPVYVGMKITISAECVGQEVNPIVPMLRLRNANEETLQDGCNGAFSAAFDGFIPENASANPSPSTYTFICDNADAVYAQIGVDLRSGMGISNATRVNIRVMAEIGASASAWEPGYLQEYAPTEGRVEISAARGVNQLYAADCSEISATWASPKFVYKVNGMNGYVNLTAEDVGAASAEDIEEIRNELSNAGQATLTTEQEQACKRFASLFVGTTARADAFLFFTDPHLVTTAAEGDVTDDFDTALNQIAAVYNATPTSACVSGGDWLNNKNTINNASWILGKIDGAMKKRFDDYVLVVGNHDTNYQGYEYIASGVGGMYDQDESQKCMLTNAAINNLWSRGEEHSYYAREIDSGMYYIFDTGIDWYPEMDDYRWEQIDWFANRLLEGEHENSAGLLHIVKSGTVTPFAENIAAVANAYNQRATVTLNGKSYDFTSATGAFRFMIAGHTHADETLTVNSIPVVVTTNLKGTVDVYSFDLMLADYATKTLHVVRVGGGQDRSVTMAEAAN